MRTDLSRFNRPASPSTMRRMLTFAQDGNAPGINGSKLAASFLRDAASGGNSVDIVTIGDSNAGYSQGGFGGGGGGWTRGWLRSMNDAGIQTYSSPMGPVMSTSGPTITAEVLREDDGVTVTTLAGFFSNVADPYGTVVRGSASGPANVTTLLVPATTFLPYGVTGWDYAYIPSGSNAQSFGQSNATYPGGAAPNPALPTWCQPGTDVRYRSVYVTSSTVGGSFNPTVYRVTGGSYIAHATKSQSTFSATGPELASTDLAFKMPQTTPASAIIFGWNYIGFGYGPCQISMDCLYKVAKGCAVNQLHYGSGQSTATIAGVVTGASSGGRKFLQSYLISLRDRQIAAGGTGRVIVWINAGINSAVGGSSFVGSMSSMIDAIRTEWVATGSSLNNLAFVCSATHPLDTDYGGTTEATLSEDRAWLNTFASGSRDVTAIDFSALISASQMTANGYYAGAGANEAHLSQAGYYELSRRMMTNLIASA